MTVDTFRNIFEKLELGKIEPNEEKIFKEVADKDEDGVIGIDDFRKILEYNAEDDGEGDEQEDMMGVDDQQMEGTERDMDDMQGEGDYGSEDEM